MSLRQIHGHTRAPPSAFIFHLFPSAFGLQCRTAALYLQSWVFSRREVRRMPEPY